MADDVYTRLGSQESLEEESCTPLPAQGYGGSGGNSPALVQDEQARSLLLALNSRLQVRQMRRQQEKGKGRQRRAGCRGFRGCKECMPWSAFVENFAAYGSMACLVAYTLANIALASWAIALPILALSVHAAPFATWPMHVVFLPLILLVICNVVAAYSRWWCCCGCKTDDEGESSRSDSGNDENRNGHEHESSPSGNAKTPETSQPHNNSNPKTTQHYAKGQSHDYYEERHASHSQGATAVYDGGLAASLAASASMF